MKRKLSNQQAELLTLLPALLERYKDRRHFESDPVYFVHQYKDPADQEVVALLSALLAFGNVKAIHQSVGKLLAVLGPRPREFIVRFDPAAQRKPFETLGHRWVRGHDLVLLLVWIRGVLKRKGSLKAHFLENYRDSDADIGPMLDRVTSRILDDLPEGMRRGASTRGFKHFFPGPRNGSPCKRLCMFLRWMVRPADGVDLGLWPEIPASRLVMPLDIHVYRFGRRFRLSQYKTARWDFSVQLTEFIRQIDDSDPLRFDFPICHHGMEVGW